MIVIGTSSAAVGSVGYVVNVQPLLDIYVLRRGHSSKTAVFVTPFRVALIALVAAVLTAPVIAKIVAPLSDSFTVTFEGTVTIPLVEVRATSVLLPTKPSSSRPHRRCDPK